MRVAVARNIFVAQDATEKHEAAKRQAEIDERRRHSRGSESRPGSHILGYADTPEGEAHSLIGMAEEVEAGLAELKEVGVAYVLLFGQGSRDNLRRFAREGDAKVRCAASAMMSLVLPLGVWPQSHLSTRPRGLAPIGSIREDCC